MVREKLRKIRTSTTNQNTGFSLSLRSSTFMTRYSVRPFQGNAVKEDSTKVHRKALQLFSFAAAIAKTLRKLLEIRMSFSNQHSL